MKTVTIRIHGRYVTEIGGHSSILENWIRSNVAPDDKHKVEGPGGYYIIDQRATQSEVFEIAMKKGYTFEYHDIKDKK